jgi:excisionase family DNA binding protein
MDSPILLVKEAAEYLRVSPDVIYNYCNSKPDFPAVKVGGQWRIHKALLDDWWFDSF